MSSNSGQKTKENYESWESLFRKTLSKERPFTFSRPSENPIHWINFLGPFDQQDTRKVSKCTITDLPDSESAPRSGHVSGDRQPQLKLSEAVVALAQAAAKVSGESHSGGSMDAPGWPFIPISKVQMFKCEKCCLEFCSPMNHRRHLRMIHRRPLHAEKEDGKSQRQQLATFWDNLAPEEAYKIVAVKNLVVEDLTGEKVVRALTHLLQQPSLFALPHAYVKSGAILLELVQSRSSRVLLTSSELFKILDGSSEKMFPSFGLSAMQRYIFEGGAGKVGLETKNLVASLGFLVEHNLVKAFIKDKDEAAWRCQTALVEEEEASQRKRAQIQARKRMKKVRQRDSKDREQKRSDSAIGLISDSETSDDGVLSSSESAVGYGLQLRPPSNAFENLYHRLAGEGSDSDHHLEVISTAGCGSCENDLMLGNPDDEVSMVDEVGIAFEDDAKESLILSETNGGSSANASGFRKPYSYQKRKYLAERRLFFRGKALLFPHHKQSWKERNNLSARDFPTQITANNFKEDMPSWCPRVAVGDASVDKVAGFRPRQYVAKPVRIRNYQSAAQTGATVWTKKLPKRIDAALDKIPHCTELANGTSPDIASPVQQADGSSGLSAEVSAIAVPHDISACSLSFSSTTLCPSIELTRGGYGSNQQLHVAASRVDYCDHESLPSDLSVADSGQCDNPYQAEHHPGLTASVVIGSVVIGSVNVSLVDSMVDQEESPLTCSLGKDEMEARKVIETSERDVAKLLYPAGRTKESLGALHENGVINCATPKEHDRDGKSMKTLSQLDPEGKENNEHSVVQAGKGSIIKHIAVQGENFKGPRLKVWRPVVSNASHDSCVEIVSSSDGNSPADCMNMVSSNQSTVVGMQLNSFNSLDLKVLELGQTYKEDGQVVYSVHQATSAEENRSNKVEEGSAMTRSNFESAGCLTTVEALACFLSQRWSDAINASDSVIFSVEDEEGCVRSSCENIGDVLIEDVNVYAKDSGSSLPQSNKDAYNLQGNVKKTRGLWKEGCSGSAMAANRRLTGKDNFHFTSRYPGYRYVPK